MRVGCIYALATVVGLIGCGQASGTLGDEGYKNTQYGYENTSEERYRGRAATRQGLESRQLRFTHQLDRANQ